MSDTDAGGDQIEVGNVTNVQGVAIGRNAHAMVTGNNVPGDVQIDSGQLRSALEELYGALAELDLVSSQKITAQMATGNALEAVHDNAMNADTITSNLKRVGETLNQANVVVEEGTSLWNSIARLAPLLGPLVGGARIVAGWFGVPLP